MKVLQLNSVCGYGSTGRIATDLYEVLIADGHECCIVYGRGDSHKRYNAFKIENRCGFYLHVLKTRLTDLHGLGSKAATQKLIKKIDHYQPDIIQLHNIHGYYVNIELLFNYLSKKRIPIVWLLHDQWSFSPHAANFDISKDKILPIKNQYKNQNLEYPKSFFDNSEKNYALKKRLFNSIENMTIVTPSNWLSDMTKKSFLKDYPVKLIHNGIDVEKFSPIKGNFREEHSLQSHKIILGVASVWDEKKGLEAFNYLADHLGDDYKIVLVGIDDKEKNKLHEKIYPVRRTNNIEELAALYTTADVFVNPTLQDNFPTTNIESLACGTPVITYKTGGSPEAISHRTGIVVEKGNQEELKRAIIYACKNKFLATDCRERAIKFNKKDVYQKYISLYSTLINQYQHKNNESGKHSIKV